MQEGTDSATPAALWVVTVLVLRTLAAMVAG
jgi:hypothetical protein